MSGDISSIDEKSIGTEASRSMTNFLDASHLQLTSEDVLYDGLSMEKLEAHVETMIEEDAQLSFGLYIDEGQCKEPTSMHWTKGGRVA